MTYLRVVDFEQFQTYKDRRPPWIKLHRELWSDPRFFELKEEHRYFLISLFVVASQNDNRIPYQTGWLKRELATTKAVPIQLFIDAGWLAECDGTEKPIRADWSTRYIPEPIKEKVFARDGGKCVWCGATENIEYDHVIPISKGGTGTEENIQLLCRSCNRKKRSRTGTEVTQVAEQNSATRAAPAQPQSTQTYAEPAQLPSNGAASRAPARSQETEAETDPEKRQKGKAAAPPSDERRRPFTEFFISEFQRIRGTRLVTTKADFIQLDALLKKTADDPGFSLDELKARAVRFLSSTDDFYANQGQPLAFFCTRINAFIGRNGNHRRDQAEHDRTLEYRPPMEEQP